MRSLFLTLLLAALPLTAAPNTAPQEFDDAPTHECVAAHVIPAGAQPKNIIFMIGDGMGTEQISVGWLANHGRLNLEQLPVCGFSRTPSFSHGITDSAAGGTALACGQKTINGHIGQDAQGKKLTSVLRTAQGMGKSTGLVVTKDITDATPAAFYAHTDDRQKAKEIAEQLKTAGITFVRGGGHRHFNHEQMEAMRAKGTDIKLSAHGHMETAAKRGDVLPTDVAHALAALEKNENGLFLMIEGSQIDTAGHANELRNVACEMLDFDKAIGVVLTWMQTHPDTLLVITADHQTGGLSILDAAPKRGYVRGCFTTGSHNGVMVPVFAVGAGADAFRGVHENTEIAELIRRAMQKAAK